MTTSQAELAAVISEVIEDLALMIVQPVHDLEAFQPQLRGWIDFTGPVTGRLALHCREEFARALAANLLGTEPGDAQTQANAWDALAELLNVVCGNLVTSRFDANRPFTLSTPQIRQIARDSAGTRGEANPDAPQTGAQVARLLLDGAPVEFILTTQEV